MSVQSFLISKGFKLNQYEDLFLWEYCFPASDDPSFINVYQCDDELSNCKLYIDGWVENVSLEEFLAQVENLKDIEIKA